jgi:hypothetical protein
MTLHFPLATKLVCGHGGISLRGLSSRGTSCSHGGGEDMRKSFGTTLRSHEGANVTNNFSHTTKPERLLCRQNRGGNYEKLPLIGVTMICRLLQFEPGAQFVLEVPSDPIIANISPSIAREARLDHSLDEGAAVLVLNERLVKQALGQSQGYIIHFGRLPFSLYQPV